MSNESTGPVLKTIVAVLAVIGGLAVLALIGMSLMHFTMMGSMACC